MTVTEDINAVVIAQELVLPTIAEDFKGNAGTIFLSGAKLWFNPTDAGTAELVTST